MKPAGWEGEGEGEGERKREGEGEGRFKTARHSGLSDIYVST